MSPRPHHLSFEAVLDIPAAHGDSSSATAGAIATTTTRFPQMPVSPTATLVSPGPAAHQPRYPSVLPNGARSARSTSTHSAHSAHSAHSSILSASTLPDRGHRRSSSLAPRINLEGSWLDLESDSSDGESASMFRRPHLRRKSSLATMAAAGPSQLMTLASSIKDLTRRSSMRLRNLTTKMSHN
ncbi:hypothetical protein GGI07_005925 [Coemansia sp. Benny D115]|nr:hypothetical protein GGI07_005925 [Coemansia sp. Benny D115]